MADRFPLILNTSANQIQEIASGDQLDLSGNNIANAGVITATTFKGNGDFVELDVDGHTNLDNVSIAGFTTTGTLNVTSDYPTINLTDTNNNDFRIQNRNGVLSFVDVANGDVAKFQIDSSNGINSMAGTLAVGALNVVNDLDVDGHTNLDNVSIAGVTTMSGDLTVTSGDVIIQGTEAKLHLTDTNNDDDYLVFNNNGTFKVYDATNNADRLQINSSGVVTIGGNTNFGADIDVDGHTNLDNVSIAGVTTMSSTLTLSSAAPNLLFTETDANPDWGILCSAGQMKFQDMTASANIFTLDSNKIQAVVNLDALAGVDVTGNVIASGNITGVDGTFTGNVSVGGTLTYEDVTNVDSIGIVTARDHINIVTDNKKLRIGAGQDLQIYHSTFNYIESHNDSEIHINANTGGSVESMAKFKPNGAVELYHNNLKKVETYGNGIIVYGPEGGDGLINLYADEGDDNADKWRLQADASGTFFLKNYASGSWENSISAAGNSGISLYHDNIISLTTTSEGIEIKKTASGATARLQIEATNGGQAGIELRTSLSGTNRAARIDMYNQNTLQWSIFNDYQQNGTNDFSIKHGSENAIRALPDGAVELYHDNSVRIETLTEGAKVKRHSGGSTTLYVEGAEGGSAIIDMFADDGDDNADKYRLLSSSGGGFYLQNYSQGGWQNNIAINNNLGVDLYYQNSKKFETHDSGVKVTGDLILNHSSSSTEVTGYAVQRIWAPTIAAGNVYKCGQWYEGEGAVQLYISVRSVQGGHSGSATYLFQGGYASIGGQNTKRLLPMASGRGHGDGPDTGENSNAWEVLIDNINDYTYAVYIHVPSGRAQKVMQVSVTEMNRGNTFTDFSSTVAYSSISSSVTSGDLTSLQTSHISTLYAPTIYNDSQQYWRNSSGTNQMFTLSNNAGFNFQDNVKAEFGGSGDLKIYHDGSHTRIAHGGTGQLIISGNDNDQVKLMKGTGEEGIILNNNAAVVLHYNNVQCAQTVETNSVKGWLVGPEQYLNTSVSHGEFIIRKNLASPNNAAITQCARMTIMTNEQTGGGNGYGGAVFFGGQDVSASNQYCTDYAAIGSSMDNVDLGNATPVAQLNFWTRNGGTFSEKLRIYGDGTLQGTDTTIGSLSDERLKKNIKTFEYDLEDFKALKPKTFNWIKPEYHTDTPLSGVHRGFIAQDLEKIDPELISENTLSTDSEERELVGEDAIAKISILGRKDAMYVSVIQQLMDKIEKLETEVAALKGS